MSEFIPLNPKRIGAVISAYTGILCGEFSELQKYAEEKMGYPVMSHDFGNTQFMQELKAKAKNDFHELHRWCGGKG